MFNLTSTVDAEMGTGKFAGPAQGLGYFEKDGYYAKDDATHKDARLGGQGRRCARALPSG